jgi:integrase
VVVSLQEIVMNHTTTHGATVGTQPSDHVVEELHRYDEHLRDVNGLAAGTRQSRIRVAGRLLRQKFKGRAIDIAKLRPDDVRQFLASQLDAHRTASNASCLAAGLRSYFRYRTTCGDRVGGLIAVISNPVHWRLASLPRALKADEVTRLLNSSTSARRWPKRSYAIVRCALDLGLRAGEIARLMISDIDWRSGTVALRGTKSLRQDILPLPVETGQALADYLQHERPTSSHPSIFVRHKGTHAQPITSSAVQQVIKRACRRAGLMHFSAHSLRHTLACRLVESGSSLKEVADVLRHRSLNTTLIYAKLDTPKLSTVPLPWPGSQS